MRLTVAYITGRKKCRFDWFVESLLRERPNVEQLDILIIDSVLWYENQEERRKYFSDCVNGRFEFRHMPPKNHVWQGPTRRTTKDYFLPANSRNTVFIAARGEHIIFCDDLSVLFPGWLSRHMWAAEHGYILAGMTFKSNNIVVENGMPIKWDDHPAGMDRRGIRLATPFRCDPGWLYGGNFSVPLRAAVQVNGQDEITASFGSEDYLFGMAMENCGYQVWIDPMCITLESDYEHGQDEYKMARDMKIVTATKEEDGHYVLRRYRNEKRVTTIADHYKLEEARELYHRTGEMIDIRAPEHDWRDSKPLEEV